MNSQKLVGVALLAIVGVAVISLAIRNQGYGDVSEGAYEAAKALYGICLAKSEERLLGLEQLVNGNGEEKIEMSEQEENWILNIIADAKRGNWKSAAEDSRRIMEDQVKENSRISIVG